MSIRKYLEDVAFALIILIAYRALWVGEVITFSSFLGLLASCAIGVGAYQTIKFALIRIKKSKESESE